MPRSHRSMITNSWKKKGLIITSKEELDEIYDRYINTTHCEKCGTEFNSTRDRQMDHAHEIDDKWGHFRNVLCRSCNVKRGKIRSTNTSGYPNIHKHPSKSCAQGYTWKFRVFIDGKSKTIKTSIDKEWLIEFATQWKLDNHYDD